MQPTGGAPPPTGSRLYRIGKEQELRVESKTQQRVWVTLLQVGNGTAEIFGTELAPRRKYAVLRAAVFSWSGCEVEVEGDCHAYVAEETPMVSYLNVHVVLEGRRAKAKQSSGYGPKVLIAGGCDVGKSTLSRILLSYGARVGSAATFVDIDVGQNGITMPGAVAAVRVTKPFDVETGLGLRMPPLAYYFGRTSPSANLPLYKRQVDTLAAELSRNFASKPEARQAGMIVNTCGWTDGDGFGLLVHAIRAFKIDVVLVMDHERLYNDIKSTPFEQAVECIKLRKSGGVVARDGELRRADRARSIREYFYGPLGDLQPHNVGMSFPVMKLCTVGGGPQAPSTALPLGAERTVDETQVALCEPTKDLLHSVLAVSYGDSEATALSSNLAGFLLVSQIDEEAGRCLFLAPCAGRLPSTLMLRMELHMVE